MTVEFVGDVEWDGKALLIRAVTGLGQVLCRIPRNTIHALPIYSDAIEREIRSERREILERLAPALRAKLSAMESAGTVELFPWDVRW
jgi:hypothetical protein